ncbi:TRAP transporter small permease [Acuticoccus sp. I52.16.1]|uniref:TRAP transporter small permease n=1 Tax=Acuticoccus sp. I52.16.1 TaxID=2928472 RepID=UPI001FD0A14B|nr:TRAP transporter small permease [Acuticoccus sp. I52.16.1]UOM32965.1 TRAP transporter small permease [Acuticoccus sp. I52.16.1]
MFLTVATFFMAVAMVVMVYEAVSRYGFSTSHWWAEELVRFCVIWSVLLAIGVANRRGHFIRMDVVVNLFGPVGRKVCGFVAVIVGLIFCGALFYASVISIEHLHRIGMRTDSNLDLPLWIVRLALPLGAVLYGLYFVWAAFRLIAGEDPFEASADDQLLHDNTPGEAR